MFFDELKSCFSAIESVFSKKDLEEFMNCDYHNLSQYHFGLGTWIRTKLLSDSDLYDMFIEGGVYDKDDMSCMLIELFYVFIRNKYK